MKLHDYLRSLPAAERKDFATRCDTSVEYLLQIGSGKRTPKAQLAVLIERESGGRVACEDLIPDLDWAYLRGNRPTAEAA